MEPEAGDRDPGHRDLDELEPLRHLRLVVAVGDLAADRGEDEEREDEDRPGERDQRLGVLSRHLEQDQEDQRGFQKIVVEGAEELAPEQRRETSRGQQVRSHPAVPPWRPGRGPEPSSGLEHDPVKIAGVSDKIMFPNNYFSGSGDPNLIGTALQPFRTGVP